MFLLLLLFIFCWRSHKCLRYFPGPFRALGEKMGALSPCLTSVFPALGQVQDVILRPRIRDRLGLRFRRVLKDMSMSRLLPLLSNLLCQNELSPA